MRHESRRELRADPIHPAVTQRMMMMMRQAEILVRIPLFMQTPMKPTTTAMIPRRSGTPNRPPSAFWVVMSSV